MLSGASVTLLVSGSIAAYKSAELIRELRRAGAELRVAMSRSATEFISQMTLQTLAGSPVSVDLFSPEEEAEIGHISLADEADVVLIAPATANILAKAALGIADDLLSTILLATRAKLVFAPAMNVNMWRHPATQGHVATLRARGATVIEPGEGELACGWIGAGRFPELPIILDEVASALSEKNLSGCDVLVTAGPTREPLDPIRFLSNRSSGKMGYAIAQQARRQGANVVLVSGPTALSAPLGVRRVEVETAQQMEEAVFAELHKRQQEKRRQFVFMAAAVSDHRPTHVSDRKLKNDKSVGYEVAMSPNTDILKRLGMERKRIESESNRMITLIGFAAETTTDDEELRTWAKQKLESKDTDLMVGNSAETMGKDSNRVWLLERGGREEEIATADKLHIARKILKAALRVA